MTPAWIAVIVAGLVTGGLLILGLLLHPENRTQNRLFAATICVSLVVQVLIALRVSGFSYHHTLLLRLMFPLRLLVIPLFYLYVRSLACSSDLERRDLLHGLPALLGFSWYFLCLVAGDSRFFSEGPFLDGERWLRSWILLAVAIGYTVATFRCINRFERALPNIVSRADEMNLSLLRLFLACFFLLLGVEVFEISLRLDGNTLLLRPLVLTIVMAATSVFALRYSRVFAEVRKNGHGEAGLSDEDVRRQSERLLELFIEAKPYLDPQLRLSDLAERMSLKPYQVSQVLARGLRTNFFDLVNQYRVEEAKRRLCDPDSKHLSILGVALDSGFNSKSTFAVAFRRFAKETPSEFRARQSPSHLRSK